MSDRKNANLVWLLGGVILLGAALRFYGLGRQCFFHDEIFEFHVAQRSFPYIVKAVGIAPVHSPLNQFISHIFLYLGRDEFFLRLPAALWGTLGIGAVFLAGSLFFNRRTGLFAAFLLAISSYHVRYSQDGRMYALLVLAGLLSQYYFWRALRDNRRRSWAGYVLFTALALHTHLFAVFILAAQVLFVLLRGLVFRRAGRGREGRPLFWLSLLLILVLFLPRLIPAARSTFSRESFLAVKVEMPPLARSGRPAPAQLTDFTTILILFAGGAGVTFFLYWSLFVIGAEGSLKRHGPAAAYLILAAAVPFVAFVFFKPAQIFSVRYLIFLLPVYYLLAAAGAERLRTVGEAIRTKHRGSPGRIGGAIQLSLALVFLLAAIPPLRAYYRDWSYPIGDRLKYDWRKFDSFLAEHGRPGDIIIPAGGIWYYHLVYLREYLSPRLQARLAVADPAGLGGAGIWWVGGDPDRRPYPPGIEPVAIDPGIPGLPVSCGRGPASFTEVTFPGLVKLPDHDALGITGQIPVQPGRIFWLSIRIRGLERHYERYSPYPGIFFYGPPGEKSSPPYLGVRMIADLDDGWKRVVMNGITPDNAVSAQVIVQRDRLHIGGEAELADLRFFGDWGKPSGRDPD